VTCRASTGVCDPAEKCDGTHGACPADVISGTSTVCGTTTGACDVAATCTGASANCPANVTVTDGTTPCTGGIGCCPTSGGVCLSPCL
jgi:hypothetical protein